MSIALHWYLPTHGDGRTLVQAGAAAQLLQETSRPDSAGTGREATLHYLAQVARAAEEAGFDAGPDPTGTTCHDAWITCAALSQVVDRLRFLVAFRPGSISPTLAAQQAATFQRHTGGRLALNIVTGGDDEEQRRFGDGLSKDERYDRTEEFLTILRGAWSGTPFDFHGEHLWTEGAVALGMEEPPEIYFGGASDAALRVAARHADVALTWGDPPPRLAPHLDKVRELADAAGRELRFGIRLHVIARDTSEEAWEAADALIADADDATIAAVQQRLGGRPPRASAGCGRSTGGRDTPRGLPQPVGRDRAAADRRRHRAGRLARGDRRPHGRVPRPRHLRVHPVRLPPRRGGLRLRRGRGTGPASARADRRDGRSGRLTGDRVRWRSAPSAAPPS